MTARQCYDVEVIYEWDPAKAARNQRRHGVSFVEARSVFLDPMALTFDHPDHSDEERREITIGVSSKQRVLFVSPCMRAEQMRIISARKARRKEIEQYAERIGSSESR
jgi:hypothetical protein